MGSRSKFCRHNWIEIVEGATRVGTGRVFASAINLFSLRSASGRLRPVVTVRESFRFWATCECSLERPGSALLHLLHSKVLFQDGSEERHGVCHLHLYQCPAHDEHVQRRRTRVGDVGFSTITFAIKTFAVTSIKASPSQDVPDLWAKCFARCLPARRVNGASHPGQT
jgi:hypothetical protein